MRQRIARAGETCPTCLRIAFGGERVTITHQGAECAEHREKEWNDDIRKGDPARPVQ